MLVKPMPVKPRLAKQISRIRSSVAAMTLIAACGVISTGASAADMAMASIQISSPTDGAVLQANSENKMEYAITLGEGDDHFHVWVDDQKSPPQRALKGSFTLPKMTAGEHAITVKIVDKAHVPTGPEKTVMVEVE